MEWSLILFISITALSAGALCVPLLARHSRGQFLVFWELVEAAVSVFLMLGILFAAAAQVVIRYAISSYVTLPWTEEFARLMLVWLTFLGAAMLQRLDDHTSMAVVYDLLPAALRQGCRIFGDVVVISFLLILVWNGLEAARFQAQVTTITLGLPVAVFAYSVPVGGLLMIVHTLNWMRRRLQVQGESAHDGSSTGH